MMERDKRANERIARMVQHWEDARLAPPRRTLRLRRRAMLLVLFLAGIAIGHVALKGAANVTWEMEQVR